MKLYHYPLSGHAHRARLFISLLGILHDLVEVDLGCAEGAGIPRTQSVRPGASAR